MIEKDFGFYTCVSCGCETCVAFIVKGTDENIKFKIPLCRRCSNKFAEDVISCLKAKLEKHKTSRVLKDKSYKELQKENVSLKRKVRQMNIKSSNHKAVITAMRKEKEC